MLYILEGRHEAKHGIRRGALGATNSKLNNQHIHHQHHHNTSRYKGLEWDQPHLHHSGNNNNRKGTGAQHMFRHAERLLNRQIQGHVPMGGAMGCLKLNNGTGKRKHISNGPQQVARHITGIARLNNNNIPTRLRQLP